MRSQVRTHVLNAIDVTAGAWCRRLAEQTGSALEVQFLAWLNANPEHLHAFIRQLKVLTGATYGLPPDLDPRTGLEERISSLRVTAKFCMGGAVVGWITAVGLLARAAVQVHPPYIDLLALTLNLLPHALPTGAIVFLTHHFFWRKHRECMGAIDGLQKRLDSVESHMTAIGVAARTGKTRRLESLISDLIDSSRTDLLRAHQATPEMRKDRDRHEFALRLANILASAVRRWRP